MFVVPAPVIVTIPLASIVATDILELEYVIVPFDAVAVTEKEGAVTDLVPILANVTVFVNLVTVNVLKAEPARYTVDVGTEAVMFVVPAPVRVTIPLASIVATDVLELE
jgi:hypothetical protein